MNRPKTQGLTRRATILTAAGAAIAAYAKVSGLELGVCEKPGELAKCEQLGYDYLEPSATTIAGMTDTAFAAFRDQLKASKIYCRSTNILLSGPALKVVGTDVNLDAVENFWIPPSTAAKRSAAKSLSGAAPAHVAYPKAIHATPPGIRSRPTSPRQERSPKPRVW